MKQKIGDRYLRYLVARDCKRHDLNLNLSGAPFNLDSFAIPKKFPSVDCTGVRDIYRNSLLLNFSR